MQCFVEKKKTILFIYESFVLFLSQQR